MTNFPSTDSTSKINVSWITRHQNGEYISTSESPYGLGEGSISKVNLNLQYLTVVSIPNGINFQIHPRRQPRISFYFGFFFVSIFNTSKTYSTFFQFSHGHYTTPLSLRYMSPSHQSLTPCLIFFLILQS